MTALSWLLSWLFLYLFAVASLSLCSINGNQGDDVAGGRAIESQTKSTSQKFADAKTQPKSNNSPERSIPRDPDKGGTQKEHSDWEQEDALSGHTENLHSERRDGDEQMTSDNPSPSKRSPPTDDAESLNDGSLEVRDRGESKPAVNDDANGTIGSDPTPGKIGNSESDGERSAEGKANQRDATSKETGDDGRGKRVNGEHQESNEVEREVVGEDEQKGRTKHDTNVTKDASDEQFRMEESIVEDTHQDNRQTGDIPIETKDSEKEDQGKVTNELEAGPAKRGRDGSEKGEVDDAQMEDRRDSTTGSSGETVAVREEITGDTGDEVDHTREGVDIEQADLKEARSGEEDVKPEESKPEVVEAEGKEKQPTADEVEKGDQVEGRHANEKEEIESRMVEPTGKDVETGKEEKVEEEEEEEEEGKKKEEEMPSFDEWKKKMLQQAQESLDREFGHGGQGAPPMQKFNLNENSKNHASADCGAKILGTNPEAQSASAILNINRDLYMLNPCSAKSIWFVVELCEPIQVKLIELANFELFSSVPESFKVSISDRYPVREWHLLGTFLARDERALQSFPLTEETMFAKYMKVEMLTFFGSEHFCPLSVLRVFGTSMVEEIDEAEAEDNSHGDASTGQDVLPVHPTPLAEDIKGNGILDHAKDAVFNFVKTAAKVFTGTNVDDETYADNATEETGNSALPEGGQPDEAQHEDIKRERFEDHIFQGKGSESFHDANNGCDGQAVCYQENYSNHYHHCCLSLFAQTAGSILLCCRALRRVMKPLEADEERTKLSLPGVPDEGLLSVQVMQTKMERTQMATRDGLSSSVILEPTPQELFVGGFLTEKMETSSPPPLILSTKASSEASRYDDTSTSNVLATNTESESMIQAPVPTPSLTRQTEEKDVHVGIHKPTEEESRNDVDLEIQVLPIPPPPTVDQIEGQNAKPGHSQSEMLDEELHSHNDLRENEREVPETTVGSDEVASGQTAESTLLDKGLQSTESNEIVDKDGDSTKEETRESESKPAPKKLSGNGKKGDNGKKSETESGEESDKVLHAETKDKTGAIPAVSNRTRSQQAKSESDDSLKAPRPATNDKTGTQTAGGNNKSSTTETGNAATMASFSPSASSLSGLSPLPHGTQKESVLMRLNNRIKTLEINMSLSGLYLEELSQRYRKQMDEMQKAFNKKIKTVQEGAQKAQEVRQEQAEKLKQLMGELERTTAALENVTLRTNGILREVVERHLFLMLCEVIVMVLLFMYCLRKTRRAGRATSPAPGHKRAPSDTAATVANKNRGQVEDLGRRNSDGLLHVPFRDHLGLSPGLGAGLGMVENSAFPKTGSLDDLLIIGPTTPLREALRQASEPSKQKQKGKNKGRHKANQQRPLSASPLYDHPKAGCSVSSSSSNSSLASAFLSSSSSTVIGVSPWIAPASKHSTAGLLFKGPAGARKGPQRNPAKPHGSGPNQSQRTSPESLGHVNGVQRGSGNRVNGVQQGGGNRVNGWNGGGGGCGRQNVGGSGIAGGANKHNQNLNGYGRR